MAVGGRSSESAAAVENAQVLSSIRAGRCIINGTLVSPDIRRGILELRQTSEGLYITWRLRSSCINNIINYFFLPFSVSINKLPNHVTPSRILAFTCKETGFKQLYWIQEADVAADDLFISEVTTNIQQLKTRNTQRTSGAVSAASASTAAAAAAAAAGRSPGLQQQQQNEEQLRQLLRTFAAAGRAGRHSSKSVSLSKVLDSEAISLLSSDKAAMQQLTQLLPPSLQTEAEAAAALRCPQLSQSLAALTQAILTDPRPILISMGITSPLPSAADPLEAFALALEEKFKGEAATAAEGEAAAAASTPAAAAAAPGTEDMDQDGPAAEPKKQ